MTKNEALKLALEALKHTHPSALTSFYTIGDRDKAIKAIQEHLAQPEQEPLDEWSEWRDMVVVNLMRHGDINKDFARRLAYFYQSKAPQRKPLTNEDVNKLVDDEDWYNDPHGFVRAIEAAHGIKGEA